MIAALIHHQSRLVLIGLIVLALNAEAAEFATVIHQETKFTVVRVDLRKEQLRLFLNDDKGMPIKSFANLETLLKPKGESLVFAMNAGMYHGNFSPVGLCIAEGKQLAPLNLANGQGNFFLKPNGVFCVTETGAAVLESSKVAALREKVLLATQSGPMLVLDGRIHPAFKQGSTNKLFRNGVGIVSPHEVVFAISGATVNFYDFATLFRDALHCQNALFLDGTISSLHAPQRNRSDKKMDLGPIIGITQKQE